MKLLKQVFVERRHFGVILCPVIGCPDVTVSSNSWVQRKGERMDVGCNNSKQTRHLVCKGREWVGDISNCSWGGEYGQKEIPTENQS